MCGVLARGGFQRDRPGIILKRHPALPARRPWPEGLRPESGQRLSKPLAARVTPLTPCLCFQRTGKGCGWRTWLRKQVFPQFPTGTHSRRKTLGLDVCPYLTERQRAGRVGLAPFLFRRWKNWCTSPRKVEACAAASIRGNSGDLCWRATHLTEQLENQSKFPSLQVQKNKPNQSKQVWVSCFPALDNYIDK